MFSIYRLALIAVTTVRSILADDGSNLRGNLDRNFEGDVVGRNLNVLNQNKKFGHIAAGCSRCNIIKEVKEHNLENVHKKLIKPIGGLGDFVKRIPEIQSVGAEFFEKRANLDLALKNNQVSQEEHEKQRAVLDDHEIQAKNIVLRGMRVLVLNDDLFAPGWYFTTELHFDTSVSYSKATSDIDIIEADATADYNIKDPLANSEINRYTNLIVSNLVVVADESSYDPVTGVLRKVKQIKVVPEKKIREVIKVFGCPCDHVTAKQCGQACAGDAACGGDNGNKGCDEGWDAAQGGGRYCGEGNSAFNHDEEASASVCCCKKV